MRLLKKIFNSKPIILLRNFIGFRPIKFFLPDQKDISISDTFIWRNENGFITYIRFSDIIRKFYGVDNSYIEIIFFDNKKNILKKLILEQTDLSNELIIDQKFFEGHIGIGIFFIFHGFKNRNNYQEKISVSNRCYVGYSKNNQNPSFVHGNYLAGFKDLASKEYYNNIIQRSFFRKKKYRIQNDFTEFDRIELIFTNPLDSDIKFWINGIKYSLNGSSLEIVTFENYKKPIISIASKLMFFRPIVFTFKGEYYDVYHS